MRNIKKEMSIFDDWDENEEDHLERWWNIMPSKMARRINYLENRYNTVPTRINPPMLY